MKRLVSVLLFSLIVLLAFIEGILKIDFHILMNNCKPIIQWIINIIASALLGTELMF